VLLKIVYLLTCRVLSLAVLVFRGDLRRMLSCWWCATRRWCAVRRWESKEVQDLLAGPSQRFGRS
jgi:hypothetical protein